MTNEQVGPYFDLVVERVVEETPDAKSIVLKIPDELEDTFRYQPGQFLTFGVVVDGHQLVRCYSLASSPDTDQEYKVTIKRVEEGRASNYFNDHVPVGHSLKVMKPAGNFCLQSRSTPLFLFAGGSGITPVISLIKSALVTTQRKVSLVYANRDEKSVIFKQELDALAAAHSDRFDLHYRLDDADGFLDLGTARKQISGSAGADFYVCGPGAYMDVIEEALAAEGVSAEAIFIERFLSPELESLDHPEPRVEGVEEEGAFTVSVYLDGNVTEVSVADGETVLEACHRVGLDAPCACLEGYCGACMAMVKAGSVQMKLNDGGIDARQEADGWVLTCQGLVRSAGTRVEYPDAN